eukprot:20078_1
MAQKKEIRIRPPTLTGCMDFNGLAMMQSHDVLMKDNYDDEIEINDRIMRIAKSDFDDIEAKLKRIKEKDYDLTRRSWQDGTFLCKPKRKLGKKVGELIQQTLLTYGVDGTDISYTVRKANQLVTSYKASHNILEFVDLSDTFGKPNDIFACIFAIAPDPDDQSDDHSDDIKVEDEKDIYSYNSDNEFEDNDRDHYFFFGYYGEQWDSKSNLSKLFEADDVQIQKQVKQWLTYRLYKFCHDKMSVMC